MFKPCTPIKQSMVVTVVGGAQLLYTHEIVNCSLSAQGTYCSPLHSKLVGHANSVSPIRPLMLCQELFITLPHFLLSHMHNLHGLQTLQHSCAQSPLAQDLLSPLALHGPHGHFTLVQGIIKYKHAIWLGHSDPLQTKVTT